MFTGMLRPHLSNIMGPIFRTLGSHVPTDRGLLFTRLWAHIPKMAIVSYIVPHSPALWSHVGTIRPKKQTNGATWKGSKLHNVFESV